ncbi:cytoplasmic protein [Colwellia echini]|uniref:Cytoplasmic protein n=1 Tax=Colwellia echini TaxID=1982103 RepID=A0ABY3MWT3_9GAMM|nr:cytoplasmic protein [Colwellia echini]
MNITNTPNFAPTNNGNGTHLEAAVKAKELAEDKGEMALQLIENAAPSNNLVGNVGHNINIKA